MKVGWDKTIESPLPDGGHGRDHWEPAIIIEEEDHDNDQGPARRQQREPRDKVAGLEREIANLGARVDRLEGRNH